MEALGKELICMMFQFLSTPGIFFCTGFVFVQFIKCLLSVCAGWVLWRIQRWVRSTYSYIEKEDNKQ